MTQAKATARPWKVVIDDTGDPVTSGYPSISPVDESLDETIIHWDGFHHEFWHSHPSQPVQVANAYLIITAVNEHDALLREVAQLREMASKALTYLEDTGESCGTTELIVELRTALAAKER